MKKAISYVLTLILLSSPTFAHERTFPEVHEVISLIYVTPEMSKEFLLGMHPDVAIECQEGTSLPLQFLTKYALFSVTFNPQLSIKIDQTCYLRMINRRAYVSLDLIHWEKAKNYFQGKLKTTAKISNDKSQVLIETEQTPDDHSEEETL